MYTLERIYKRNKDLFVGNNHERSLQDRENFSVQLRKTSRNSFYMKQRMKNTKICGLGLEESEEFRKNPKEFIRKVVNRAKLLLDDEVSLARELDQLIKTFKKSNAEDFWESGTFDICLLVMQTKNSSKLLVKVTSILANLSICEEEFCKIMIDNGLIESCFPLLDLHNFEIIDNILWCFFNLTITSSAISKFFGSDPMFGRLLILLDFPEVVLKSKLLYVFAAIARYTKQSEYHSNILIPIFLKALENLETALPGMMGLGALTINQTQNVTKIYEKSPEIIEKIIKLTGNEEKNLVYHSLRLLANFVFSNDYIQVLLDHGLLPFIKRMMTSLHILQKKETFFILSNLFLSEEHHVSIIMADKELVMRLIEAVNECNFDIRYEVWYCIKTLTSKVPFFPSGFYETLVFNMNLALGRELDPKILTQILETYKNMLESSKTHLESLKDLLESSQCYQKLCEKIQFENKSVSEQASSIIHEFYDRADIPETSLEKIEFNFT